MIMQPTADSQKSTAGRALGCKLLALGLTLILTGCLIVEDFGTAWNEAKPDPCLNKIAESLYVTEFRRDPANKDMNTLAHAWTVGGHYYLLFKKSAEDKGGYLYRFTVTEGIFQRWRLKPTMRELFEKTYPNAAVSLARDTVTLKTIDANTKKLLLELSDKPEYWEIEEQILYNVLRDPACRFDDRDLKVTGDR